MVFESPKREYANRLPLVLLVVALVAAIVVGVAVMASTPSSTEAVCATEDSTNCVWTDPDTGNTYYNGPESEPPLTDPFPIESMDRDSDPFVKDGAPVADPAHPEERIEYCTNVYLTAESQEDFLRQHPDEDPDSWYEDCISYLGNPDIGVDKVQPK